MITESLHNDSLWFLWECFCLRIFLSIEMNRYNDYWTVITIHWAKTLFLLFKLNFSWPIQLSLSFTKPKPSTVLIKLLYPSSSLGSCALVHLHINPYTKLNKANYKIQDYFANRQIKEDVKCNIDSSPTTTVNTSGKSYCSVS
jgi:hypothetical protein